MKYFYHKPTVFLSLCFLFIISTFLYVKSLVGLTHIHKSALYYSLLQLVIVFGMIIIFHWRNRDNTSIEMLLKPVFLFNFTMLLLSQLRGFDHIFSITDFRVGFPFGNYMDFFSAAIYSINLDGQKLLLSTGYFPFSIAISNIIAKIMGFSIADTLLTGRAMLVYIFFYLACISTVLLYVKKIFNSDFTSARYFLFILATSYPILLAFERGNLVLLSMVFLIAAFYFGKRSSNVYILCLAFLISIKLLNIIFVFLLVGMRYQDKFKFLVAFLFIQIISMLYLYEVGSLLTIDYQLLSQLFFNATTKPTYVYSDSIKIFATSGFDALRLSFEYMKHKLFLDGSFNKPFNIKIFIGMAVALIFVFIGVSIKRKKLDPVATTLFIYLVVALFHPTAADYSLIMLIPFILILIKGSIVNYFQRTIVFYMLVFFLPLAAFSIMDLGCCGGQIIPGRVVYLTIKNYIFPMVNLLLIGHIFSFALSSKNKLKYSL